jgi:hypothetical protein
MPGHQEAIELDNKTDQTREEIHEKDCDFYGGTGRGWRRDRWHCAG